MNLEKTERKSAAARRVISNWKIRLIALSCCVAWSAVISVLSIYRPETFVLSAFFATHKNLNQYNSSANGTNLQINNEKKDTSINHRNENCSRYVSVGDHISKGLGNQMFYFVAAAYLAELTDREVVLFQNHTIKTLDSSFDLKVNRLKYFCSVYNFKQNGGSFDVQLERLVNKSETLNKTIVINGYFQSWKYTRKIKDIIIQNFAFKSQTKDFAKRFLNENIPPGWNEGFLRVGVHNRRGDFLTLQHDGFTVATEEYFQKAMNYYVEHFGRTQFIVVSLDREWTMRYITLNNRNNSLKALANITYSFGNTAIQDMAILSSCDHSIISAGSYGWWAGWLTGGTTIYYSGYPRPNSTLYKDLNPKEYYPPHWIPME